MLPLLALHSLVAHRGDGLRPELLELLRRQEEVGLSAGVEAELPQAQPGSSRTTEEINSEKTSDATT